MSTSFIVEIIVAVLGFIGSMVGAMATSKLTNYRLEQLEKKVDKHNDQLEKLQLFEQRLSQLETKVGKMENEVTA